jgi:hypothetical protein
MNEEQPKVSFVVQASPSASYREVVRDLNKEIARCKEDYLKQYGDEPVEVVILHDELGTGPRGYVTRGVLYWKLRGKDTTT